ncbi:MAG: exosortase/archaeosortase family protein [Dehalococcoidia bacterium]|nr:MAG: exosortase/archaeosortase family protein [Dehalococcoidia bacterium]
MLRKMELRRDYLILLSIAAGFSTLAIQLYLFELKLFTPLSPLFRLHPPYMAIFNEYTPLAITLLLLIWIKIGRLRTNKDSKIASINLKISSLIIASTIFSFLILFRVWDLVAMLTHPHNINDIFIESGVETMMRIFLFSAVSLILLMIFWISNGLNGLKTMILPSLIPAFYIFNTDVVLYANQNSSFFIFQPIYQFILEFGRFETLVVGGLLNIFGVKTLVFANAFPYRIILGGASYVIDLPCIGCEGVVGYTIIFLVLLSDFEISNKMKIIWATLGFLGTLFVNLLRLTLIFTAGAIWGASVADIIHQNAGDIIFLIWMLAFWYIVLWFTKRAEQPPSNNNTPPLLSHTLSNQIESTSP